MLCDLSRTPLQSFLSIERASSHRELGVWALGISLNITLVPSEVMHAGAVLVEAPDMSFLGFVLCL